MSTAALETEQALALFERIETLEDVARRVDDADRARLIRIVREELQSSPPVRPVAAARILQLSEKTVRNWVVEGVLQQATAPTPRLLIDPNALHLVSHVVKEIRAAGHRRSMLDEVHRRLVDVSWLDRDDLAESLGQMRRGAGTVRVPKAD